MTDALDRIKKEITENKIVLYMKGTPAAPQCGFSATVADILKKLGAEFHSVNILENVEIRQGIKTFSSWPTIPQLYINGQFIGGSDITKEMFESGELKKLVEAK